MPYFCTSIQKKFTLMNRNLDRMTPFIVMDVLERANELQREGADIIHL
jgi:hypothetical protein